MKTAVLLFGVICGILSVNGRVVPREASKFILLLFYLSYIYFLIYGINNNLNKNSLI